MSLEEKTLRDSHEKATKAAKYTSDALKQISNIIVDSTDYRVGGKREGKFIVSEPNDIPSPGSYSTPSPKFTASSPTDPSSSPAATGAVVGSVVGSTIGSDRKDAPTASADPSVSDKTRMVSSLALGKEKVKESLVDSSRITVANQAIALSSAEEAAQQDNSTVQAGAYNKNKINMTEVANATLESAKSSYKDTDYSHGRSMVNKYGALIGAGSISRHAAIADVKTQLYSRDQTEILNAQNAINNWTRPSGKKATYRTLSMDAAHSRVIDDFANNQRLVDDYLKGHGINTRNLTARDIDKMIGKQGRFNYGQTSMFHAGQSKFFTGAGRDKLSSISDAALKRNSGWAGSADKGGVYIDSELRDVLIEKRFQLGLSPKINQIQRGKGGLKNTASAWVQQGTQDTDTAAGYQHAQAIVHGARAGALIAEGSSAAVGTAAIKSIEATGRIASATAKTALNVTGKVYSHGNASRAAKWTTNVSKVNNTLDKISAVSKYIGREGTAAIHRGLKASVGFTSKSSMKKARIIGGKVGGGLGKGGKWIVTNTVGRTRVGRKVARKTTSMISRISDIGKAAASKFAAMQLAVYNHTKLIRMPFKAFNSISRALKGLAIKVAGCFIGLCIIVAVVLTPVAAFTAILPDAFLADDSYTTTDNVGQTAIMEMLPVQQDFLREVEAYWDATCTLVDADGNKLHPHHSAYFALYMGDYTDEFSNLTGPDQSSSVCYLSTGESVSYGIDVLYKTVISMATVATGNEDQDQEFYSKYCCLLLDKILHSGTWNFDNNGVIPVYIYDTGLTDGMKLDPSAKSCSISPGGCGEYFASVDDGWMHTYGDDSNEYSTWLRLSHNYNEWKGWTAFDEGYFEWAQNLWELSAEDWAAINVVLPGTSDFGSDFGGSPLSAEELVNIDSVLAEQTDNPARLAVIESALNAFQQGIIYSQEQRGNTKHEGDGLSIYQDCSSFCWNNLVNAGVVPGIDWAKSTQTFASDSHCVNMNGYSLKPGDILVNYTNDGKKNDHALMFLGFDENGKPQTIECGGGFSRFNVASNNAISIKTYNSVSSMLSLRGIRYIVNYFGD